MQNKLEELKKRALEELEAIKDSQQLNAFRQKYLDRNYGEVSLFFKDLKTVAADLKPQLGALANQVKSELERMLGEKLIEVGGGLAPESSVDWLDVTVSKTTLQPGHLHPMTQLVSEVEDSFASLGYWILRGPELESEFYNFEGLNIPSWHPAREAQDTFYVEAPAEQKWVMRTHTSSVQVRAMQKYGAPLRAIMPGRVFRNEATDASHEHTFYQIEGLIIDENISIANLVAALKEIVSTIYKRDLNVRLRPGYFPFVEPGFEMDMACTFCEAKGCPICKHSGWIEMGGCGMIHPNVLQHGGIDPKKYSGFAFGMGLTRLLMMKSGISEIRLMQSGDLRFLNQF